MSPRRTVLFVLFHMPYLRDTSLRLWFHDKPVDVLVAMTPEEAMEFLDDQKRSIDFVVFYFHMTWLSPEARGEIEEAEKGLRFVDLLDDIRPQRWGLLHGALRAGTKLPDTAVGTSQFQLGFDEMKTVVAAVESALM